MAYGSFQDVTTFAGGAPDCYRVPVVYVCARLISNFPKEPLLHNETAFPLENFDALSSEHEISLKKKEKEKEKNQKTTKSSGDSISIQL